MASHEIQIKQGWFEKGLAAILLIVGLSLFFPGAFLVALGGSFYYVLAGIVMTLSCVQLWRGRFNGVWLYLIFFIGTVIWALWESGLSGWALLPRLGVFLVLGIAVVTVVWRSGRLNHRTRTSIVRATMAAAGLVIMSLAINTIFPLSSDPPVDQLSMEKAKVLDDDGEWHHIGRTVGAQRFSPLTQITPANVADLELAWTANLGMPPEGMAGALEATPLMVNGLLYTCNMHNVVLALEAETGNLRWRFDPGLNTREVFISACRGVTYYRKPGAEGPCSQRIIATTYDARLVALDAQTGELCQDFGSNGQVDLLEGMGKVDKGYYYLTSPATLVRDTLVIGGSIPSNQKIGVPSGVIRGFNVVTGELAWAWDMGRPGERGLPPSGETYTPDTPNAWSPMSGDDQHGLVFVPLGNPTLDYVTAYRTPVMEKYGSALVALDIEIGSPRWHYQITHLDVWDYDNPAPATLVDFPVDGGTRPALILPTKRGQFFVLDRLTGEPLVETVEKAVPQNPVPGERLASTQPYPVGMPSFGGDQLTEAHMWGISPFDQLWCRIKFRQARYDGDFTPVSLKPTIVYPGYFGGANWFGVSVDPERQLLLVNVNYFPMYNQLIPRDQAFPKVYRPYEAGVMPLDTVHSPQEGAPYAAKVKPFMSPLGVPCHQPPYSEIAVVDLKTRKTLWRKPLGTARDTGPFGIPSMLPISMGVPALGGTLTTRSGLVFIAATQERTIRAFDVNTGEILWQDRLPTSGHANPMSFYSEESGRQFIVISAGGHPGMKTKTGDYLMAYALPKNYK